MGTLAAVYAPSVAAVDLMGLDRDDDGFYVALSIRGPDGTKITNGALAACIKDPETGELMERWLTRVDEHGDWIVEENCEPERTLYFMHGIHYAPTPAFMPEQLPREPAVRVRGEPVPPG